MAYARAIYPSRPITPTVGRGCHLKRSGNRETTPCFKKALDLLQAAPTMSHPLNGLPLPSPPFIDIEGVINIRGIGGCPTASHRPSLRSPILFRSGEPSGITPRGKDQLVAIGIRRVFDLRSDIEIAGYKTPTPAIEGVEFVRAPVSQKQAFDPANLAPRYVFVLRIIFAMSDSQANRLKSFE
jgi:hypothetical protein